MKKIYFAIIFWLYIAVLTTYSIVPTVSMTEKYGFGDFELRLDYWLHFGAYFGVAFLFILWQFNRLLEKKNFILYGIISCFLYAYVTELIQLLVPGRAYNIYDFVANMSGILVAYLLFFTLKKRLIQSKFRKLIV